MAAVVDRRSHRTKETRIKKQTESDLVRSRYIILDSIADGVLNFHIPLSQFLADKMRAVFLNEVNTGTSINRG